MKVVRLFQYTIEYLLFSQEYVTNCCATLDSQYKELYENYGSIIEIAKRHKNNVLNLRKELQAKKKTLEVYHTMIEQSEDARNEFFYSCMFCEHKFSSLFLLK